ncbi:MAG: PAS domain S-box protein [Myxococcaceae bacterium]|nr:PAS domain S-box protein [Myxococcaceae bacterium]
MQGSSIHGQMEPGALGDPRRAGAPLHRRGGDRLIALLDSFLSEPLRQQPAEKLTRSRVLVGGSLLLLLVGAPYIPVQWMSTHSLSLIFVGLLGLSGIAGSLILAHRSRTLEAPGLLLCTTVALGCMLDAIYQELPYEGTHAANMLVPILTVYLLGARHGFLITLLHSLILAIAFPLYYSDQVADPAQLWSSHGYAAAAMMAAWVLSWLYGTSRDAAHADLQQALDTLHESEHKLHSLVESTDDLIASLDSEGRLLTVNSAFKAVFQERFGQEPRPGELLEQLFPPEYPEHLEHWKLIFPRALQGERIRFEDSYTVQGQPRTVEICVTPISGKGSHPSGITLFGRDITPRKQAEAQLGELHRTLLDVSRRAGMAEIATGVLHNVGNTLNSVTVSVSLLSEQLRASRLSSLERATALLSENAPHLASFLSEDPRGRQLPSYLSTLTQHLRNEQAAQQAELRSLSESVSHLEAVVSMQQRHASAVGVIETFSTAPLIDDALRLHSFSFEHLGIRVRRDYGEVPPLLADRHKLLQILLNLLKNARQALLASERPDKLLSIRIAPAPHAPQDKLLIQISDNGVGISPENLGRLFAQGFTTKVGGHGFGLHMSALAAKELGGALSCSSEGPGHGATFTLELPFHSEEARPSPHPTEEPPAQPSTSGRAL